MNGVANLKVKEGFNQGVIYPVSEGTVSIGRDPTNEIVLNDILVSRKHARVFRMGQDIVVEDLGSVNGTQVNDQSVTRQTLKAGDEITVGTTVLQVMPHCFSEATGQHINAVGPAARIVSDEDSFSEATVQLTIPSTANKSLSALSLGSDSFRDVQVAYQRLQLIYQIFTDFAVIRHLPTLLNRSLEKVLEIIGAERGTIMLLNESGEMVPEVVCVRRNLSEEAAMSVSKTIARRAFDSDQSILTTDALADKRFQGSESIQLHKIRSTMCAPIKGQEKKLGVIYLDTRERLLGFTKEDLELFTAVSRQMGVIIENAQLFSKLEQTNFELQKKQTLLIASEKLSALGKIARGIAHEIFNPLTSILGIVAIMNKQLDQESGTQENGGEYLRLVKLLEAEANRIIRIVQSLTQFYRRKETKMLLVDVNEDVGTALEIANFQMEKEPIRIIKNLSPKLPQVVADRDQLQIVFLNMLMNARDAMENRGSLSITTADDRHGWVLIQFTDTGCGIPDDIRDKIFEPLFTTKEEGKGTGLGLSISRDIVESHGGRIEIESAPGRGTTFTIRLPCASPLSE
jgi:signal transduction histidine kinase